MTYKLSNGKTTTSLAEKMFDDLGYIKLELEEDCFIYEKEDKYGNTHNIEFDLWKIGWTYSAYIIHFTGKYDMLIIKPKEHQAITQQLKELGWIEE